MRTISTALAVFLAILASASARSDAVKPISLDEQVESCDACENQMFDCSDMCDCAWGGQDIMRCMICNSKCTAKKCAQYCAKLGITRKPRGGGLFGGMGGRSGGGQNPFGGGGR